MYETLVATLKGPYRLGDSFGAMVAGSQRLVASSHTQDPGSNPLKCSVSLTQVSCTLHCASWAASLASWMDSMQFSRLGLTVLQVG